jgi:phage antirepressor YoqD-like protein
MTSKNLYQRKLRVEKLVKELNDVQLFEIYRIIRDNSYNYTQNNNGILFNIKDMREDLFRVIENYVNYSIEKNKLLKKEEEKIENLRNSNIDK